MSRKKSPQQKFDEVVQSNQYVNQTLPLLMALASQGKPKDVDQLKQRITDFFNFCAANNLRPGVEMLSSCLGVSRVTFWHWCNGTNCSLEWAECCRIARQTIMTFLEQTAISGKLNPATAIFLLKNWGGYKDTISFDDERPDLGIEARVSVKEISASIAGLIDQKERPENE